MGEEQPCRHQISAEGREGGAPDSRADIPWQPLGKIVVRQLCPCSPQNPQWIRDPPAAPGGPHPRAAGCPKDAVTMWEACTAAGSWQDVWTQGERAHTGTGLLAGLGTPWGPTLEQFVPQGLHPVEEIHRGAGEDCEEWKRQPDKLTTKPPFPMFPSFPGEEVEKIRSEVESGKMGEVGEMVF
ncbi:hypothetical protein TURU_100328 [Turdus rufiventris]|nr:hypothetical protein TURU_100328 [Turdus rufiventris]